MKKTAIIVGATGLTGNLLMNHLLLDDRYKTVKILSRRSCGIQHPKIEEHLIDVIHLENYVNLFDADEVFCCIGTSKAKTPDKELYLKIDYGVPVKTAQLCAKNKIQTLAVISALGANKKSRIFYNRIKGKMEEAVLQEKINNIYLLQPSLIGGKRTEKRMGEKFAKMVMKLIDPILVGKLKKYRMIHPETIVKTMIWLANNDYESGRIISSKIQNISDSQ